MRAVYDLSRFQLSDMTRMGPLLRDIGAGARSMEETATRITSFLREHLVDGEGAPTCALVRLYRTMPFSKLDASLRHFGANKMQAHELSETTRCLTLLGTSGEKSAWQSRHASRDHRTIPLPSEDAVKSIPMVSQLLVQLGLSVAHVVAADPKLVLELEQTTYNVFFVPDAVGSPYIPAQKDFVLPHAIRSVLGFGGVLPSGDVFAVLLFTRMLIQRETADIFRNAAMNAKVALLPFDHGPIFAPEEVPK